MIKIDGYEKTVFYHLLELVFTKYVWLRTRQVFEKRTQFAAFSGTIIVRFYQFYLRKYLQSGINKDLTIFIW